MKRLIFLALIASLTGNARAQPSGPAVTLPQQTVPLLPPQFGSITQEQAWQDPCQLTLQNQFYMSLAAGGGWPVSDAPTEANTGALVGPTISTEQNTNVGAQLAYNKCLAEEEAHRRDVDTGSVHGPGDIGIDAGIDQPVPGGQQ